MTSKKKENAQVISQEKIAQDIYSMWIKTKAAAEAKPGQFISMYTNDGSKLLPRPISICEIDKENSSLRVVYRVTGKNTGTEEFSKLQAGDTIPVIGPLGNGFPVEKAVGKRVFLMGGGIGVPPILELAKQMECEKKQIVVGYRNAETFLQEEFEQNGEVYISTEDGSVGTKGNVMDAIRENALEADIIYACGPTPMLRAIKAYAEENGIECYISLEDAWPAESAPVWRACASRKRRTITATYTTSGSAKTVRYSFLRRWRSDEYESKYRRCRVEESRDSGIRYIWLGRRVRGLCGSEPSGRSDD